MALELAQAAASTVDPSKEFLVEVITESFMKRWLASW